MEIIPGVHTIEGLGIGRAYVYREADKVTLIDTGLAGSADRVYAAVEGAGACSLKLKLWDDAIRRAEQFVAHTKGSFAEAVGERFLAGLYMSIPHQGTKRGTSYLRGEYTQGAYVSSWRQDRRAALGHYDRDRHLLNRLAAHRDRVV